MLSRVNLRWRGGTLEVLLDRTDVDPASVPVLMEATARARTEIVPFIEDGASPIVRYFMERNIPGDQQFHMDASPYQTDVYLEHGLMPQAIADEIAGHTTNLFRSYPRVAISLLRHFPPLRGV
ncbi:hypothetical protein HCN51_31720 [Nonomuraea sp. FMUSA5-5]|uniref:Uncharacterized protein n=1 Tax=Nonomuraea composti TaxID=2720023 RepID=A0ABX1B813_9ACTN|nr:hypothetical protein [Nonomuraea sp. FMUSA5-5]NJP93954.1 hypothetical protein [Nonomuraea sp. FMUSA5-5]